MGPVKSATLISRCCEFPRDRAAFDVRRGCDLGSRRNGVGAGGANCRVGKSADISETFPVATVNRRFAAAPLEPLSLRRGIPRGDVLRCIIDDAGPDGQVTIQIDDKELSLAEFGRLLRVHAGWGMRIAFVPEEFVTENPKGEIRKPKKLNRCSARAAIWAISIETASRTARRGSILTVALAR